ncbi:hypothetical protein [Sulfitobacter geojensis]|uniref:hypothetical protein n=1 Tax=Sulfitobacter geojensis TaxID=1342299 RepID=UPI002491E5FF|nr:hypothetical protein [Sulfitobacter geojensis]
MDPEKREQFEEVAHSGGLIVFKIRTDDEDRTSYQVNLSAKSVIPGLGGRKLAIRAIYALQQGIPLGVVRMGGMGGDFSDRPHPSCFPVFIGSDSEGMFGHQCPRCNMYWRSDEARLCPYCGFEGPGHLFLTDAQARYVEEYCHTLSTALEKVKNGDIKIDMDAVASAACTDSEKPKFYYAEETQQHQFRCDKCGCFNDVLGRVCYCSGCGTRNDLEMLKEDISMIRERIAAGGPYERFVQDTVSCFDSYVRKHIDELKQMPLTRRRRGLIEGKTFQNLERTRDALKDVFDIDILRRLSDSNIAFCIKMFHRRHVYEHLGGEADDKYIQATGDNVRLKQALTETQASVSDFCTQILKIAEELHVRFHEILPPLTEPIKRHKQNSSRAEEF